MKIILTVKPSLADRAAKFKQLAERGVYEGLGRIAGDVKDVMIYALREEAPVSNSPDPRKRPGTLRDSIRAVQQAHYSGGITLEFRAIDYAQYVVNDTAPHEIWPVRAKALAFYNAEGQLTFAKHVFHPGTKANPFHERAWDTARGDVLEIMKRVGQEVLQQAAA